MIKKDNIRYVADLARMELDAREEELFASQLNHILNYMEELNKPDTRSTEPMSHAVSRKNVLREDKPKKGLSNEDAVKCAPKREKGSFKVPKIIE